MRKLLGAGAGLFALLATAGVASAQATWVGANDGRLRNDVRLLTDEGVLELTASSWPIAVDDLAFALRRAVPDNIQSSALRAALQRVSDEVEANTGDQAPRLRDIELSAGRDGLLRNFDSGVRDDANLTVRGSMRAGRWSANVAATAVLGARDGQALRLDGSDFSVRVGNWSLSANAMDRWWGPGYEGSLIFSTNARPMPQLALDRVVSTPSSVPVLRWAGPWRFSAFIARMEGSRSDVDAPLFMGMRLSFKPLQVLEIGLSRGAQFCGSGRPCDVATFGRVLLGRDNVGFRVSQENEPGNQMAGADFRLSSPLRSVPAAFYAQLIGEDNSSSGIPEKYLAMFGVESWLLFESGTLLRGYLEYSDTACAYNRPEPRVDCAYRQGIFTAGYRYRGRVLGYSTDSDSQATAAGLRLVLQNGEEWRLSARTARLDRFGAPDPSNSVTFGPSRYQSVEGGWRGRLLGQRLALELGVERKESVASGASQQRVYGFLSWRKSL